MDQTIYYEGDGVDDMNIEDYYDQKSLLEDYDPEWREEYFEGDEVE